jgi:predicted Holliday junction resolvase-like endonuclease
MILIIIIVIIFCIIIYLLFLNFNKKIIEIKQIKQEIYDKKDIKDKKESQIGLYRYPKLVLNNNNINNPTDINPNACEKNLVMDYDEVNLNSIKKNTYDVLDKYTQQIEFNIFEENPKQLKYVTTYINLPGYKSYNIEDTNRFELKKNNSGLINYVKLKDTETFKPHNSVIYS